MHFHHIPNAAISKEADRPLMQKEVYPVSSALQQYLQRYQKDHRLPLSYKELLHYEYTNAIKDEFGKHTHWERVVYNKKLLTQLTAKLQQLYALLKNESDIQIDSIDFCEFANSMPFRINITHLSTGENDFFYIKSADTSRIYGLELEQLLTTNHINFLYHQNTLVEEHIEGVPGDIFLNSADTMGVDDQQSVAKQFIRFNESCFARLLGDMRSYNFVVVQHDTNPLSFVIKAIDFDQQCYEGRLNLYWPQFYKENYRYVQMATHHLGHDAIEAIRKEERKGIAGLMKQHSVQLNDLLQVMQAEELSENYKVVSLGRELDQYHHTHHFSACKTMGALVKEQLSFITGPYLHP